MRHSFLLSAERKTSTQRRSARRKVSGHYKRRLLRLEALEARSLMAVLVSDALSGPKDTTISGTVYEDLNANGVKDNGENGIAGWKVYLDLDNSGTLNSDAVGTEETSAVTNVDGDYVLGNSLIGFLKPSTYRVSEVDVVPNHIELGHPGVEVHPESSLLNRAVVRHLRQANDEQSATVDHETAESQSEAQMTGDVSHQ